jgi:hypothetical protein
MARKTKKIHDTFIRDGKTKRLLPIKFVSSEFDFDVPYSFAGYIHVSKDVHPIMRIWKTLESRLANTIEEWGAFKGCSSHHEDLQRL